MKKYVLITLSLLFGLSSWCGATENRFQQFNADTQDAYATYRVALFETNKNNQEKSEESIKTFQKRWQKISTTYSQLPPETYQSDSSFSQALENISHIAQKSGEQIAAGQLAEAHETLEAIRDELSELRRRNSVIAFSDHINNYHAVMEHLLTGGFTPETINSDTVNTIRGQVAVLEYLAEAIKNNAPKEYSNNPKYLKLQKDLFGSLTQLDKAIEENNPQAISKSIKMLKPAYAKLFVNFG